MAGEMGGKKRKGPQEEVGCSWCVLNSSSARKDRLILTWEGEKKRGSRSDEGGSWAVDQRIPADWLGSEGSSVPKGAAATTLLQPGGLKKKNQPWTGRESFLKGGKKRK